MLSNVRICDSPLKELPMYERFIISEIISEFEETREPYPQ
jgi:hypothetical protein